MPYYTDMKRTREEKLLNPKPGSRIAEARDFGIDLTQVVENLRLSPEQRIARLQQAMYSFEELRKSSKRIRYALRDSELDEE